MFLQYEFYLQKTNIFNAMGDDVSDEHERTIVYRH